MSYKTDTEIEIDLVDKSTCSYIISSQHRKTGNFHKSIWLIPFTEEVECFTQTINENWKDGNKAWGVKIIDAIFQVLGKNNENEELKLAKFVDGNYSNIWHGYPADYLRKAQDRPTTDILKVWVQKGFLTKSKMSKIRRGQSCNL